MKDRLLKKLSIILSLTLVVHLALWYGEKLHQERLEIIKDLKTQVEELSKQRKRLSQELDHAIQHSVIIVEKPRYFPK